MVAELRYKAYISYSHQDEAWAKWLHSALESYRVPRRLVGTDGQWGRIPARINPVFRDREDLSAARDLGRRITEALSHSESLIVICSPAAAQSRWVNEEIRQYRAACTADRIYCLIVDGGPEPEPAEQCCFPPALFEGAGRHSFEPLAADARQWADGKQLAKLKLVAGLLGIRLDELRQRDLQRRRKAGALAGLGIAAVLALVVMTLVTQVSRRHEREMAEQMATFIVDLGEKLQSETDLETLASISSEAMKNFRGLDPGKLSTQTGKRVALTLRQAGRVNQLQGKPEDALKAFSQSRDLLSALSKKNPESTDLLYELGNAEFYIGNFYLEQGDHASARPAFERNHEITGQLLEIDPDSFEWMMERSYSHNNLAAVRIQSGSGVDEASLAHLQAAIDLIEKAMLLAPDKTIYTSHYATTLGWAAEAQYQACNLGNAMALREKARELAKTLARADPGDNDLKRRYAYAISGVAVIQTNTGQTEKAEQSLELVISILEQLSAADPSNILYPRQIAYRQYWLAQLLAVSGRLQEAIDMMSGLESKIGVDGGVVGQNEDTRYQAIAFHMAFAGLQYQSGNKAAANLQLQKALKLQMEGSDMGAMGQAELERLREIRFQWWEINGEDGLARFPVKLPQRQTVTANGLLSCKEALLTAKDLVIEGAHDQAITPVRYLQSRGYADPAFIQFCTKYGLCS